MSIILRSFENGIPGDTFKISKKKLQLSEKIILKWSFVFKDLISVFSGFLSFFIFFPSKNSPGFFVFYNLKDYYNRDQPSICVKNDLKSIFFYKFNFSFQIKKNLFHFACYPENAGIWLNRKNEVKRVQTFMTNKKKEPRNNRYLR